MPRRSSSLASSQALTTFGGNHRVENTTRKRPPGFKTRPTSRKTSNGRVRYSTDTTFRTTSKVSSAKGSVGSTFRS